MCGVWATTDLPNGQPPSRATGVSTGNKYTYVVLHAISTRTVILVYNQRSAVVQDSCSQACIPQCGAYHLLGRPCRQEADYGQNAGFLQEQVVMCTTMIAEHAVFRQAMMGTTCQCAMAMRIAALPETYIIRSC